MQNLRREDYAPINKPVRLIDRKLRHALSTLPYCECCGRRCGVSHCHHISSRGAGGHDSRDNCLGLCPACHEDAHRAKISRVKLVALAIGPWRYIPGYDPKN